MFSGPEIVIFVSEIYVLCYSYKLLAFVAQLLNIGEHSGRMVAVRNRQWTCSSVSQMLRKSRPQESSTLWSSLKFWHWLTSGEHSTTSASGNRTDYIKIWEYEKSSAHHNNKTTQSSTEHQENQLAGPVLMHLTHDWTMIAVLFDSHDWISASAARRALNRCDRRR